MDLSLGSLCSVSETDEIPVGGTAATTVAGREQQQQHSSRDSPPRLPGRGAGTGHDEVLDYLRTIPTFGSFQDWRLEQIFEALEMQDWAAGTTVVRRGEVRPKRAT